MSALPSGPTLTAVVPTFDRYGCVVDLLTDLLAQTEPPDQVVIIDSTPGDRRQPIAHPSVGTDPRVMVLTHDGVGANKARNVGLRAVTSEYALLLDDDLRMPPDCLARYRAAHRAGWEAVHGQLDQHAAPLTSSHGGDRPFWNVIRHRHGPLRAHTIAVSSSFVSVRTARLAELGWLDEGFVYSYDDYDLGYRLWTAGVVTLHDPDITAVHLQLPRGGGRDAGVQAARGRNPYRDRYRFLRKHFSAQALRLEALTDVAHRLSRGWSRPVALLREVGQIVGAYRAAQR